MYTFSDGLYHSANCKLTVLTVGWRRPFIVSLVTGLVTAAV